MDNDLSYWLALWRQPYIGPQTIQKLLALSSDLSTFFKANNLRNDLGPYIDSRALKSPIDWAGVDADLTWLQSQSQNHVIKITSPEYPARLKEIAHAPSLLFVKGDVETLSLPQIGMVGSRHPTSTGFEDAFSFAQSLSQEGLVITSGLAMGIDTASHRGALMAKGLTIAVLGHGLDQIYPKTNASLAQKIVESGALVSEFPIGTPIKAQFFPRRNRLISGLTMGIFVVEAALESGSLITAHYALEHGREVFAMPGSVHNPLAKGCNSLIRQGAKCVETAAHLLEEIHNLIPRSYKTKGDVNEKENTRSKPATVFKNQEAKTQLLNNIDYACTPIDSIIDRSGLSLELLSPFLLEMELEEMIAAVPGGYIRYPIKEVLS